MNDSHSSDELRALAGVLDTLLPASADGRLPAAGALGLAEPVQARLGDAWPVIATGLDACETAARARGAEDFASLSLAEASAVLEDVSADEPAFLGGLIFQAYTTYYEHPQVVEALGLEARPPYPGGYALEPGDLDQLARVREGPRRYREC